MRVTVENLFHTYPGQKQEAVSDVSFTIEKGEIFGFLGPSGAGKSTVQNILTGILSLQKGRVAYNDSPVNRLRRGFFNHIGVSFEHPNLYAKLTGYENLTYYAGLFGVPTGDPMQLLTMVGLQDDAHKKAGSYSKGMKQRLVFCRSLINNPKMLFLDEPTSGLDPATAQLIKTIIRERKKKGCTIFLTTHNMFTADELCDRVAFINNGKIIAMDSPRRLKMTYGQRAAKVEYLEHSEVKSRLFFLDNQEDKAAFHTCIDEKEMQTIHTQEATLEQIFIKLTGRGLK
jgi:fluoroquinolone transport system ATP-binding protein